MRWKQAIGKEVINTESAETIGKVDGLIADHESSSIVGFVVGDKVVTWSDSGGMGQDAVTVQKTSMVREPSSEREQGAIDGEFDPLGKTVITEDGLAMGSVNNIDFDSSSGAINRVLLADDDIAGDRLIGIGSYAVIVSSSNAASSTGSLSSLSKAELYEKAKERDLDGRSTMSKKELLAALS